MSPRSVSLWNHLKSHDPATSLLFQGFFFFFFKAILAKTEWSASEFTEIRKSFFYWFFFPMEADKSPTFISLSAFCMYFVFTCQYTHGALAKLSFFLSQPKAAGAALIGQSWCELRDLRHAFSVYTNGVISAGTMWGAKGECLNYPTQHEREAH